MAGRICEWGRPKYRVECDSIALWYVYSYYNDRMLWLCTKHYDMMVQRCEELIVKDEYPEHKREMLVRVKKDNGW